MKKMLILSILILCITLILPGCTNEKPTIIDDTNATFIDSLPNQDLPTPKRTINSQQDFVYALDYIAFYRIDQKISFYIGEDYKQTFNGIYREYTRVLNLTSLANIYPITFTYDQYKAKSIVDIKLRAVQIATQPAYPPNSITPILPFDYNDQLYTRANTYDDFDINHHNNGEVSVTNSEQLWYCISLGYLPTPTQNSSAERIYNKAKEVLRRIVDDNMSDYQKLKAIYNFLTCEITYDRKTGSGNFSNGISIQSYYLEGVFDNHCAVCDGKSKAYVLLAKMEGIDAVRVTDYKENKVGHAYNYVKLADQWYLSCTTFGSKIITLDDDKDIKIQVPSYNMFLTNLDTPYATKWNYNSQMYPQIKEQIADTHYDYSANTFIDINGQQQDLIINSAQDLMNIIDYLTIRYDMNDRLIEFHLDSDQDIYQIRDIITTTYPAYDILFVQNLPTNKQNYSVILKRK